jgi:hypothetical protein
VADINTSTRGAVKLGGGSDDEKQIRPKGF